MKHDCHCPRSSVTSCCSTTQTLKAASGPPRQGPLAVRSVEDVPGLQPVYNLEVHGEHVYEVTDAGVLVHNNTGAPCLDFAKLQTRIDAGEILEGADLIEYQRLAALFDEAGEAGWKSRRAFQEGDSGLKDHARRHSNLSPPDYLARGQANVAGGKFVKGGGKNDGIRYYIRKLGEDSYSITITDKNGGILSIDTWSQGGSVITKNDILKQLRKSGATPPNGFWENL